MLNVYCQYSFAGYKIYHLTEGGITEVTANNRCNIPQSSIKFFSHYGLKLALTVTLEHQLMLLISEIACNELDDMGRKKTMSIQFVANDKANGRVISKLAASIIVDFPAFEEFIASLFTINETLQFDFSKLQSFINEVARTSFICNAPLKRVYNCQSPLFVYFGENFKSSIADYSDLISKQMQRQAVRLHWNELTTSVEDLDGVDKLREYIQRILYRLHIWKSL